MPKKPVASIIQGKKFSKACAQLGFRPERHDEDCLYLNIFAPQNGGQSLLPVMFWIHGGAYVVGTASSFIEEGLLKNLVSRGVVVVSTNYRLGSLGKSKENGRRFA